MRLPRLGPDADPDVYRELLQIIKDLEALRPLRMSRADAATKGGTYGVGALLYYTDPIANDFIGEVCVTAGSPGTWKTWGPTSL